jgi:5-methylcytosine-specific restriction endonuclease McrA
MTGKRTPEQLARHAAYERKYREANPEKYRERAARKRKAHAQTIRQKWRERYDNDPEFRASIAARAIAWNRQNEERRRLIVERYGETNREVLNAKAREWKASNKDHCKTHKHARRARVKAAQGSHTTDEWHAILKAHGYRCSWCGAMQSASNRLTRDHYIPLSKGGSNFASNIVPACKVCNSEKRARDPLAFARSLGFLL